MKKTAILTALILCSHAIFGQSHSAGIFNSPKGFGVSFANRIDSDEFNTFTVFADFYGVLTGRSTTPGIKFNYTHNHVVRTRQWDDVCTAFYIGPGVSVGFLRDYEDGYYSPGTSPLKHHYGVAGALSGTAGYRFLFQRRISIDLSWTLELGLHMRQDEQVKSTLLNIYKNGLFQIIYPQLRLEYYF